MSRMFFFRYWSNGFCNIASTGSVKKWVLCNKCQKSVSVKRKKHPKSRFLRARIGPPSPRIRSPYPRWCRVPPSAVSLSLFLSRDSLLASAHSSCMCLVQCECMQCCAADIGDFQKSTFWGLQHAGFRISSQSKLSVDFQVDKRFSHFTFSQFINHGLVFYRISKLRQQQQQTPTQTQAWNH